MAKLSSQLKLLTFLILIYCLLTYVQVNALEVLLGL